MFFNATPDLVGYLTVFAASALMLYLFISNRFMGGTWDWVMKNVSNKDAKKTVHGTIILLGCTLIPTVYSIFVGVTLSILGLFLALIAFTIYFKDRFKDEQDERQ